MDCEPVEFSFVQFRDLREPRMPLSMAFQAYLSGELARLVPRSMAFLKRYGSGWGVTIFLMAKRGADRTVVKGPVRVPRLKTVEFYLTLPGDHIPSDRGWIVPVSTLLIDGVAEVLAKAKLDGTRFLAERGRIANRIRSDPKMVEEEAPDGPLPPFLCSVPGKKNT